MGRHTADNPGVACGDAVVHVRLRNLRTHHQKQGNVHGAQRPQKVGKHNLAVPPLVNLHGDAEEVLPHEQPVQGEPPFLKDVKQRVPLHILVEHQTAERPPFLLLQFQAGAPPPGAPIAVLEVHLVDLRHMAGQLIFEFSPLLPVGHDVDQDKFQVWKRLNHAVNPAGDAAG